MKKNEEKTSVLFLENGPIQVTGVVKISGQYGEKRQKIPYTFADVEDQKTNLIAMGRIARTDLKVKPTVTFFTNSGNNQR